VRAEAHGGGGSPSLRWTASRPEPPPMLEFDDALAQLLAERLDAHTESRTLARSAGRVLAAPVTLARDQPSFDRATMDGYAVCLADGVTRYRVRGVVDAGTQYEGALQPGECVRIMTGAPCPANTTVVQVERTDGGEHEVHVTEPDALVPGKHIAWAGEDGRAGDTVLAAGTKLSPSTLSVAAMAGARELDVFTPPRLALIGTGDEVGSDGEAGIADSNGPLLAAFAAALGCPARGYHAPDDPESLRRVLEQAGEEADIVVTVGGVSMGRKDLVPDVTERLGYAPRFHKVAIQPGKPVLFARHAEGRFLLGLPGNPVSVLVTAHLFLAPLVGLFLGGWTPRWQRLPLAREHQHRGKRRLFLPARCTPEGLEPVRWNGSGDLLAAGTADGLLDLAPDSRHAAGAAMAFLPFLGHTLGEVGTLPPRGDPAAHC